MAKKSKRSLREIMKRKPKAPPPPVMETYKVKYSHNANTFVEITFTDRAPLALHRNHKLMNLIGHMIANGWQEVQQ